MIVFSTNGTRTTGYLHSKRGTHLSSITSLIENVPETHGQNNTPKHLEESGERNQSGLVFDDVFFTQSTIYIKN